MLKMPTIESRKYPGNIQFIDAAGWEMMKQKGLHRRYKVIDDGDIQETVIPAPESIVDFQDTQEMGNELNDTVKEIELTREEIKAKLDDLGIVYNTRLGTNKLLELLKDE